jgi:hypothetical protein
MNTFTKKSLHIALAGLGTLGLAGAADAVMVNPNGLGQVLIYPYYTVRSPAYAGVAQYNTLLSIVNTTNSTKAVKVRFREGKASAEVLDFNVFLSPFDMWTAAVEPTPDGGAQIETSDRSCTIPQFTPNVPVPFRTGGYEGDAVGNNTVDRLTEGYFEVFEMATYTTSSATYKNSLHSSGVPKDCSSINDSDALSEAQTPQGGLSGGATMINVLTGDAFTEDATALINFTDGQIYSNTGVDTPNFSSASPTIGVAVDAFGQILTGIYSTGTLDAEKAVAMSLQKSSVVNEFVLEISTLSGTDWVLTFPGKHAFVDPAGKAASIPPFQGKLGKTGACDPAVLTTYNREEGKITPQGPDFSPAPGIPGFNLCWEANIISFKNASVIRKDNVLGSANSYTVDTQFQSGWGVVTFDTGLTGKAINPASAGWTYDPLFPASGASTTGSTFAGLPTIGFAVQTFVNGTLSDSAGKLVQSSYGGNFGHRYTGPLVFGFAP